MKVVYVAEDGTQFNSEKECNAYENAKVIYCIKNTVNEYRDIITRFCSTLEEAKRELKNCCDWYDKKDTGRIFRIKLDTNFEPRYELVYAVDGTML
jgi:hypothetical protein